MGEDMGTFGSVREVAHVGGFPGAETWGLHGAEGGYHQGFHQWGAWGTWELWGHWTTVEVLNRGFSGVRDMGTLGLMLGPSLGGVLGHKKGSHQGFHWGGTWGHWGKEGGG